MPGTGMPWDTWARCACTEFAGTVAQVRGHINQGMTPECVGFEVLGQGPEFVPEGYAPKAGSALEKRLLSHGYGPFQRTPSRATTAPPPAPPVPVAPGQAPLFEDAEGDLDGDLDEDPGGEAPAYPQLQAAPTERPQPNSVLEFLTRLQTEQDERAAAAAVDASGLPVPRGVRPGKTTKASPLPSPPDPPTVWWNIQVSYILQFWYDWERLHGYTGTESEFVEDVVIRFYHQHLGLSPAVVPNALLEMLAAGGSLPGVAA